MNEEAFFKRLPHSICRFSWSSIYHHSVIDFLSINYTYRAAQGHFTERQNLAAVILSCTNTSSSCARSDPDIGDRGLKIPSVISSPDELIIGRFFSGYKVIQTVCVFCALSPSAFGTTNLSTQYLFF